MKLGLLSDVHGNRIALEAAVADGVAAGVDAWWVLGDLAAIGPEPVTTLELIADLPDVAITSGNTGSSCPTGRGCWACTRHRVATTATASRPTVRRTSCARRCATQTPTSCSPVTPPTDRRVGNVRAVNLGSVGNPVTDDLRASYVILHAERHGHALEHRRVAYDVDAFLEALARSGHPEVDHISSFVRGEQIRYPARRPGAPVVV